MNKNIIPDRFPLKLRRWARFCLWFLTLAAWLAFIIPGLSADKDKQNHSLPVQSKIQVIAAGKILRLQDSGLLPPSRLGQLRNAPAEILENALKDNENNQYIIFHQALLYMHRREYAQAQKLLESVGKPEENLKDLYTAALASCSFLNQQNQLSAGSKTQPAESLSFQEAVNRELKDYWQTTARREIAVCAKSEPTVHGLDAENLSKLKRDGCWISMVFLITGVNFLICTALIIYLLAAKLRPERFRTEPPALPACSGGCKFDPLKICAAYVVLQWLMIISALVFSRVFVFKQHQIASIFCTYLCTYVLLTAAVFYCLPLLRESTAAPCSALQILQLGPLRWRDGRWGWIGFSAAMVSVYILSQIVAVCSGSSPRSDNPILAIAADSRPSEWLLLGLQLSVCGPFFEELLFRGLLFGGLRGSWPVPAAALLSSLVFGITHFDPQGTIILTGLGLCFAFIYHKSGSLWASVIAHGLWNGFVAFNLLLLMS